MGQIPGSARLRQDHDHSAGDEKVRYLVLSQTFEVDNRTYEREVRERVDSP